MEHSLKDRFVLANCPGEAKVPGLQARFFINEAVA